MQTEREEDACRLLEAGVRALLPRLDLTVESLVSTIRAVAAGSAAAPASLLVRTLAHARQEGIGPTAGLTERERAVLKLLADGSDTLEMAHVLCFSERTVKNVVHDILMKLNCRTRAHAVALAHTFGRDLIGDCRAVGCLCRCAAAAGSAVVARGWWGRAQGCGWMVRY